MYWNYFFPRVSLWRLSHKTFIVFTQRYCESFIPFLEKPGNVVRSTKTLPIWMGLLCFSFWSTAARTWFLEFCMDALFFAKSSCRQDVINGCLKSVYLQKDFKNHGRNKLYTIKHRRTDLCCTFYATLTLISNDCCSVVFVRIISLGSY